MAKLHTQRRYQRPARSLTATLPTLAQRVDSVMFAHAPRGAQVCVGLSGGVDSVVLLDLLLTLAPRHEWQISALHVNHQLNARAPAWARFCRELCRARGVPLRVVRVRVARGDSVEAAAREARYAAYRKQAAPFVALAQHQDDQAETVLLQLLRGAGVKGLAAMPVSRADRLKPGLAFVRPLLHETRAEIAAYAVARGLSWVEDDSNDDAYYLRNFLRREILPRIGERVPEYRVLLGRAAGHLGEAAQLLDALAQIDAQGALIDGVLAVKPLATLSEARANNLLRYFLATRGARMPDARRLAEALRQVLHAKDDARVAVDLGVHSLRRHRGALYVVPRQDASPAGNAMPWHGEPRLSWPGLGELTMRRRRGQGIALEPLLARPVTLRLRGGGEKLQPDARRPRRAVKDLLQTHGVPPWRRERLPFLWSGDRLVWVAGIGIDCAFQAAPGVPGVTPLWTEHMAAGSPA